MGADLSNGLEPADYDEEAQITSDKECEGCNDPLKYGDQCVLLSLVYPAPCNGQVLLLDAIDPDDGSYTVEPLLYCYACWSSYTEEIGENLRDTLMAKKKSANPSPLICAHCKTAISYGDYCAYAAYGTLDTSPRTGGTQFVASPHESVANAELTCMDCLEWINAELGENIWPDLWVEGELQHEEDT